MFLISSLGAINFYWAKNYQHKLAVQYLAITPNATLEIFNPADFLLVIILSGSVISVLLASIFYWLTKKVTQPIAAIAATVKQVAEGEINSIVPVLTQDEIGDLALAFNRMIEEFRLLYKEFEEKVTQLELAEISAQYSYRELQKEKQKVEAATAQLVTANKEITKLNDQLKSKNLDLMEELTLINQRLNQFLEAIPVGVIVLDANGKTYFSNQKAQQLLDNYNTYPLYIAGTNQLCPPEQRLGVTALKFGQSATSDNLEIRQQNLTIPIESWETPIFDAEGKVSYAIVAFQDITERKQAEAEKVRFTQELMQLNQANERFVPREFLQLLDKKGIIDVQLGDNVAQELSVLFSDIRGFTSLSERISPEDNFRFINAFLSRMAPAISEHKGFIDKYIGDEIMALFSDSADDAVKAGIAMLHRLKEYNKTRQRPERPPLKIGIGINTGLMMLGIVGGENRIEGTVISDAVNLAARLEELTKLYGVSLLVSQDTFLRLNDVNQYAIRIVDRVQVKGKSNYVTVYEVFDADPTSLLEAKLATKTIFEEAILLYHQNLWQQAKILFENCLQQNPHDQVVTVYLKRLQQH